MGWTLSERGTGVAYFTVSIARNAEEESVPLDLGARLAQQLSLARFLQGLGIVCIRLAGLRVRFCWRLLG
jgi:hypothetical protein